MKRSSLKNCFAGTLILAFAGSCALSAWAQADQPLSPAETKPVTERPANDDLRVETTPVTGGAEIVTIFARNSNKAAGETRELPLMSVLRDTLGDTRKENDRLRNVWMLTYTEPSLMQKVSAFVPFLYTRTANKKGVGSGPPPSLIDLNGTGSGAWQKLTWLVFKKLVLADFGVGPRASFLQYKQNTADYRRSATARALAVLSVYESTKGDKVLSDNERHDIEAKLTLSGKTFGSHMQNDNLGRVYRKEYDKQSDIRSQNWELLRQYSEAQGLYFEPLKMPDGTARHAIVWTAAEDIHPNRGRKYDGRFLNMKDPWNDASLRNWKGHSEKRWFDGDGRQVDDSPGATQRTMIPLALYGLDHPKIPALLIDFRDSGNAKRREMSRRVLNDVTSNVLSVSPLSSIPYMLGRYLFDWVTGRRGMDINQVSRLRSYSQLKLLLALDSTLDADLRCEIADQIESVSLNPLENDIDTETMIARRQYENLMAYARRPDGLPAKLDKMRREEMVKILHSPKERAFFQIAHAVTFGLYTHREKPTPELLAQIDTRRQLEFHERRVAEIARTSVRPEVDSNVAQLRESLFFISSNGSAAKDKTARSLAKIYAITDELELRDVCLAGLYKINNTAAKNELLAIYRDPRTDERLRTLSAHYLKLAVSEGQRISSRSAAVIATIGAN